MLVVPELECVGVMRPLWKSMPNPVDCHVAEIDGFDHATCAAVRLSKRNIFQGLRHKLFDLSTDDFGGIPGHCSL